MRVLFLDTETNGLPQNRYAPYTETKNWPAIVQIAWQVWDIGATHWIQKVNTLVKPTADMVWSDEAAAIHRISRDAAESKGVVWGCVLRWLLEDCADVDLVVAHNLSFDKAVLWSAALRESQRQKDPSLLPEQWWPPHELCTMRQTTHLCKIPSAYPKPHDPYKWPRLSELWKTLFPTKPIPVDLHDADKDVECLALCFQALVDRRLVPLPTIRTPADPLRTVLRLFSALAI
jgi:DNA polymerase-3 subunit epsilon